MLSPLRLVLCIPSDSRFASRDWGVVMVSGALTFYLLPFISYFIS